MEQTRGSIAFFSTYRPPVPLDIFSSPVPASKSGEISMTDGKSYNYNGSVIPPEALKAILKRPKLAGKATEADVNSGDVTGLVFVSERDNLETLYIGVRFKDGRFEVNEFADLYDQKFKGVARMEDSGCIGGGYKDKNRTIDYFLIYVSTVEEVTDRRKPWTAVYKTNLLTGKTDRFARPGVSELSPSVSPSGKQIAVASFQVKGWNGEIEDMPTDIVVMNVEGKLGRRLVIRNGGWPTWGSDTVLFFHRKVGKFWGVFRADISTGQEPVRVTPDGIDAVTPAAISATQVVVATMRDKWEYTDAKVKAEDREIDQYRHIEIFDSNEPDKTKSTKITLNIRQMADHYNPFVIDGGKRIGYHRCKTIQSEKDVERHFHKINSPIKEVGVFRVSGVFPTFSNDGSKLAFVDNEFKAVWLADSKGLRVVYKLEGPNKFFSPVFNQNPKKDTLYVCVGPSFSALDPVDIYAIRNVSEGHQQRQRLTTKFNNAFPSSDPEGKRLVFRSTRCGNGKDPHHKNLYIMSNADEGEGGDCNITRLTDEYCTDTHCQWSPNGNWIVFSSTRDKPKTGVPDLVNGLDPGFFSVYLVKPDDKNVVIRVIKGGNDFAGHVNHPFFSPDGNSIVVGADLAAVSVDPISLPLFVHSVRPYGDIFVVDLIDPKDTNKVNNKNEDLKKFRRITHSRYENSTPSWTKFSTDDPYAKWNLSFEGKHTPTWPHTRKDGGESWRMTGHLCLGKKHCC